MHEYCYKTYAIVVLVLILIATIGLQITKEKEIKSLRKKINFIEQLNEVQEFEIKLLEDEITIVSNR